MKPPSKATMIGLWSARLLALWMIGMFIYAAILDAQGVNREPLDSTLAIIFMVGLMFVAPIVLVTATRKKGEGW